MLSDTIMNSDFVGRNHSSFDCAGQMNYEMQVPGNFSVESMIHTRRNLFNTEETVCKSDISHMDNTCSDLYEEELEYLHDDYPASVRGDYNIDELLMWEHLMNQQRELNRMKLARQYEKLLQAEDQCTFMRQLIMKQQRLRQVLNEEDKHLKSRWVSRQYASGCGPGVQLFEQHEKKDSGVWKSSLDQFSEEDSSPKSQMLSNSGKIVQPQEPPQKK